MLMHTLVLIACLNGPQVGMAHEPELAQLGSEKQRIERSGILLNAWEAADTAKTFITVALLACIPLWSQAQQTAFPIWPGVAPGSEGWTQKEVEYLNGAKQKMVRNVVRPTLTPFLPEKAKATGTAVIVCPGGGFRFHSWQSEGTEVAEWLRDHGVAAFVLKYRTVDTGATEEAFQKALGAFFSSLSKLPADGKPGPPPAELNESDIIRLAGEDGRQAVRVVRKRAAEFGVAADRIGLMGFSAGGIVTNAVALQHDKECRPDFVAPIYGAPFEEITVPADAPPMFILCATDDSLAATGSVRLYQAWKAAGKPVEMHLYAKGGHGFGMNKRGLPVDRWIERLGDWMEGLGLMKRAAGVSEQDRVQARLETEERDEALDQSSNFADLMDFHFLDLVMNIRMRNWEPGLHEEEIGRATFSHLSRSSPWYAIVSYDWLPPSSTPDYDLIVQRDAALVMVRDRFTDRFGRNPFGLKLSFRPEETSAPKTSDLLIKPFVGRLRLLSYP